VDILRGLNCDQFQGYLFGTAMPPVDLPAFILRQNRVDSLVPEPPARFAS
jgi:EAL domain-containing protein (putative c-di-GMP-specific phosphodiesterase class I)